MNPMNRIIPLLLWLILLVAVFPAAGEAIVYPDWVTPEMKEYIPEIFLYRNIQHLRERCENEDEQRLIQAYTIGFNRFVEEMKANPERLAAYKDYFKGIDVQSIDWNAPPDPPWLTDEVREFLPPLQLKGHLEDYYNNPSGIQRVEHSIAAIMANKESYSRDFLLRMERGQEFFRYNLLFRLAFRREKPNQFDEKMKSRDDYFRFWMTGGTYDRAYGIDEKFEWLVLTVLARTEPIAEPQVEWQNEYGTSPVDGVDWLGRCKLGTLMAVAQLIGDRAKGKDLSPSPRDHNDPEVVARLIGEFVRMAQVAYVNGQVAILAQAFCRQTLGNWQNETWDWEKPEALLQYDPSARFPQTPYDPDNLPQFWPDSPAPLPGGTDIFFPKYVSPQEE